MKEKFTALSSLTPIRDTELSFKARGLHHLLLSYLNGWKVKIEFLVNESIKDGRTAIASALRELEERGYLTRQAVQDSENHFIGWESVIRESPDEEAANSYAEKLEKRKARKSVSPKNGFPENQVSRKSENPIIGFSDFRETAYIINTDSDQISKDQILTPPPPTPEECVSEEKTFEQQEEVKHQSTATLLTDDTSTRQTEEPATPVRYSPRKVPKNEKIEQSN